MIIKYNGIDGVTYILEGISNIKIDRNSYKEAKLGDSNMFRIKPRFEDRLVNCTMPYNGEFKIIYMTQNGNDYLLGVRGDAVIYTDAGMQIDTVI